MRVELQERIIDHHNQYGEVQLKYEDAKRTEPGNLNQTTLIRNDAILKLHIVDAENLPNSASTLVQARQDQASSQTNQQSGTGPIWNEAIIFDIKNEIQPLVITLRDASGRQIIQETLKLQNHKDYREMGQDIWLPNYATNGPKLRVRITYNYSDIQKYQALEDQWKEMLDADINEYEWINTYLEQIQ